MRGIGLEVEEMMKLFMVMIIGLGIVILIIATSGGISSLLNDFCVRNPTICGQTATEKDYNTAKASFDALVVAHDCVLDPTHCDCKSSNPCIFNQQSGSYTGGIVSGFQITSNNVLSKEVTVSCDDKAQSCTIKNFNTPDNFKGIYGNAKDWISGFGDPNFLIYFQKFPQGEDGSWKSWSSWYEGVGTIMMLAMCAGSLAKPVWKIISILRPSKTVETVTETIAMIKKDSDYVKSVFKRSMIDVTKFRDVPLDEASEFYLKVYKVSGTTAQEQYIVRQLSSEALMKTIGGDIATWTKNNWKPEMTKAMAHATAYVTTDAVASYALSRLDSEVGKFIYDNPHSMVLGMPLKKQESTQLKNIEYDNPGGIISKLGKPVILDKSKPVSFALASPCNADLTVRNSKVLCGFYSYDEFTGNVVCLDPKIIQSTDNELKCGGDFSEFKQGSGIFGRDYWLPEKYFYSLEGMIKDKTVSFYQGESIKKLRIPSASQNAYLQDIERQKCSGGVSESLVCYKADLYNNGQMEIEGLQMVCGDYKSLIVGGAGGTNYGRARYVRILQEVFDSNVNDGGYEFCYIFNSLDPMESKSAAFEEFKQDIGIQSFSSTDAGEIVWVKERVNDPEWKLVDGYNNGNDDVYYEDNKGEKYYPKIYEMAVFSGMPGSVAFFKDWDVDGKWDQFALFVDGLKDNWLPKDAKSFIFDDQDGNGKIDSISYRNCWIDAVSTSVDAKNYPSTSANPNFCYAVEPWYTGVAATTAVFAIDALAKRVPHPATWIASTVANCGLAVAQVYFKKNWPEGGKG
jgi:hypothetical protein